MTPRLSEPISQTQNDLSLRLLSRLAQDYPEGNLLLSPAGLTLALAAACLGAAGKTQQDLAQSLGLPRADTDLVQSSIGGFRSGLLGGEEDSTAMATALWLPAGSRPSASYLERLQRSLETEASALDPDPDRAAAQIAAWSSRVTRGRIPSVPSAMGPEVGLLLMTVVDLHARWKNAFDPALTREHPFRLGLDRSAPHPMMMQSGDFPYSRSDDLEAIALPYAGGRWRMVVLLPSVEGGLRSLASRLDGGAWRDIRRRLKVRRGTIGLPPLQLMGSTALAAPLAAMGLARAFDLRRAEFPELDLRRRPAAIGDVQQTIRLEVDEEGTEASAVTLMLHVVAWPSKPSAHFEMFVDRPFVFGLEEEATGTLLFLGLVRDPRSPLTSPETR